MEEKRYLPVAWEQRWEADGWDVEYAAVGSLAGVLRDNRSVSESETIARLLSQTAFLFSKRRASEENQRDDDAVERVAGLFLKFLQRGTVPLPTLGIERAALESHGLIDEVVDVSEGGVELGWKPSSGSRFEGKLEGLVSNLVQRDEFEADRFVLDSLDSDPEREFLSDWVRRNLGGRAGHWIIPQAPLHVLRGSGGKNHEGDAWIDFLLNVPDELPLAIEIDGPTHSGRAEKRADRRRDRWLKQIGIDTIRIPVEEVSTDNELHADSAISVAIDRFGRFRSKSDNTGINGDIADFVLDCSLGSKIQFALIRALERGWLSGDSWSIELTGIGTVGAAAVEDALNLLAAYDALLEGNNAPVECVVSFDGETVGFRRDGMRYDRSEFDSSDASTLKIAVEWRSGVHHSLQSVADDVDIVIRGAFLPVNLATEHRAATVREPIACDDYETAVPALTVFLQQIFRKADFRHGQAQAVYDALRLQDRVVLLSTGAGKSIIYQLAGLLMPGVTLVVDPIVALIDDQVAGLRRYGIDRVAGISSQLSTEAKNRTLKVLGRRGHWFALVAPERLQIGDFRAQLKESRDRDLINLAVIDEAHCVSEWGHDFRPAYLNLRGRIADTCSDIKDVPPPILALTATASRSVLADVIADLGFDSTPGEAVIRPDNFDRTELRFFVKKAWNYAHAHGILESEISSLASAQVRDDSDLGVEELVPGIIYTRLVNGPNNGIIRLRDTAQKVLGNEVGTYSGSAPGGWEGDWDNRKRDAATKFRTNEVKTLVATSAYGMGIDKPDIRYIVHFGMPSSLEGYYQEAGRAGRDGNPAKCLVIFCETDEERNDKLLDPSASFDALKKRYKRSNVDYDKRDDVLGALFFHLNGFVGVEQELSRIVRMIDHLGDVRPEEVVIPIGDGKGVRKFMEYALARLCVLRYVHDYEVDRRARCFKVRKLDFDYERSKSALLTYVGRSRASESAPLERRISRLERAQPKDARSRLTFLARVLVEFIYNTVEASNRRMIRNAMVLARSAQSGDDMRREMLHYFEEGVASEQIERLLLKPDIELTDWFDLINDFTPAYAGQIRGDCQRELETNPNHRGLLLTLGVTATMIDAVDDSSARDEISAAIQRAPETDESEVFARLYGLARGRARRLGPVLTHALLDTAEVDGRKFDWCRRVALAESLNVEDGTGITSAVVGVFEAARAVRATQLVVRQIRGVALDGVTRAVLGI